jgi:hypothetical protein
VLCPEPVLPASKLVLNSVSFLCSSRHVLSKIASVGTLKDVASFVADARASTLLSRVRIFKLKTILPCGVMLILVSLKLMLDVYEE